MVARVTLPGGSPGGLRGPRAKGPRAAMNDPEPTPAEAQTGPSSAGGEVASPELGELAALLARDGAVTDAQLRHAARVRAKIRTPRPLVPLLLELGLLSPDQLRATLRAHRLELRIGTLLVELGHLSEDQLDAALRLQQDAAAPGAKLGEILVDHGLLGGQDLARVLASQLGVPFVDVSDLEPDPDLLSQVPLEACREHRFLPVRVEAGRPLVVFADPLDKGDAGVAQAIFGDDLAPAIASERALDEAIGRLEIAARIACSSDAGDVAAMHALEEILDGAFARSASAVHFEPGLRHLRIRVRCDGVLSTLRELPESVAAPMLRLLEREAGVEEEQGAAHREGAFRVDRAEGSFDVRASFLATTCGESAVLCIRDLRPQPIPLDALGLLPPMLRQLEEEALFASSGLLLIAGPRDSGRRTTLHACACAVSGSETKVVLVEDSRELRLDGISHCALGLAGPPPLAERIARTLHHDPDVLAIGNLREAGDLGAALRAARSGPRVFAVTEAIDAVAALAAAVAAEPCSPPQALLGALAQRLVRRVCQECSVHVVPSAAQMRALGYTVQGLSGRGFRRGTGCSRCNDTGYDGRIGVFELLLLDEAALEHLRTAEAPSPLRRSAGLAGPATMLEDGLIKASRGITTLDELIRVVPCTSQPRPLVEIERALGEER